MASNVVTEKRGLEGEESEIDCLRHCHVLIRHNSPRLSYASHVIIQIACPKYPESKDRMPKSFSFIPRVYMHAFSGSPHDTVCICLVLEYFTAVAFIYVHT